jgi:3-oxoacyl-[acyl-carrier protein] reductase
MEPGTRKLAIVTGASSGIGRTIAFSLAERGWDIAFTHVADERGARAVESALRESGADVMAGQCDAGVKGDVDAFFETMGRHFRRLPDLLVNNAGIQTWGSLLDVDEADWDRVIRTNLKGCFLNTQRFAKALIGAGRPGSIVNIGSGCNKVPFPGLVAYTASKGGIEMFTKVAALELGPHRISVNCVAPGAVLTERTLREAPEYADTWSQITPLGRVGEPRDVANAVLFFASEQGSFVTGQTLSVDGGLFMAPRWPYAQS